MKSQRTLLGPEAILLHPQRSKPSTNHVVIGRFIDSNGNALDIIQETDQVDDPDSLISKIAPTGKRNMKEARGEQVAYNPGSSFMRNFSHRSMPCTAASSQSAFMSSAQPTTTSVTSAALRTRASAARAGPRAHPAGGGETALGRYTTHPVSVPRTPRAAVGHHRTQGCSSP